MSRIVLLMAFAAGTLGLSDPVRSAEAVESGKETPLTAGQKQAALAFVKEHHPQLRRLIAGLKNRDPAEFDKAIRDVSRTSERLERLKDRDPQRYDVDLKMWKVNSRIRLLAARMAGDDRPELESQLRDLLNERTDLRLQRLALERERLTTRIERVDSQVEKIATEREATVERELKRLRRSVRARARKSDNPARRPGGARRADGKKPARGRQPDKPTSKTDKP